jgi:hypothetical protein
MTRTTFSSLGPASSHSIHALRQSSFNEPPTNAAPNEHFSTSARRAHAHSGSDCRNIGSDELSSVPARRRIVSVPYSQNPKRKGADIAFHRKPRRLDSQRSLRSLTSNIRMDTSRHRVSGSTLCPQELADSRHTPPGLSSPESWYQLSVPPATGSEQVFAEPIRPFPRKANRYVCQRSTERSSRPAPCAAFARSIDRRPPACCGPSTRSRGPPTRYLERCSSLASLRYEPEPDLRTRKPCRRAETRGRSSQIPRRCADRGPSDPANAEPRPKDPLAVLQREPDGGIGKRRRVNPR